MNIFLNVSELEETTRKMFSIYSSTIFTRKHIELYFKKKKIYYNKKYLSYVLNKMKKRNEIVLLPIMNIKNISGSGYQINRGYNVKTN